MTLTPYKALIIFAVVFLHNTFLDLFLLTDGGKPLFLWEKSAELATILVHFLIACSVALVYLMSVKFRHLYPKNTLHISDKVWGLCSVLLLLSIVFVLL